MQITSYVNQGKRDYMEDEVFYVNRKNYSISGVFDGHGGGKCSKFLKRYFLPLFEFFIKQKKTIKHSLYFTIVKIHSFIMKYNFTNSGSTCNIVVTDKKNNHFYVANIGDSRAIISFKNKTMDALIT